MQKPHRRTNSSGSEAAQEECKHKYEFLLQAKIVLFWKHYDLFTSGVLWVQKSPVGMDTVKQRGWCLDGCLEWIVLSEHDLLETLVRPDVVPLFTTLRAPDSHMDDPLQAHESFHSDGSIIHWMEREEEGNTTMKTSSLASDFRRLTASLPPRRRARVVKQRLTDFCCVPILQHDGDNCTSPLPAFCAVCGDFEACKQEAWCCHGISESVINYDSTCIFHFWPIFLNILENWQH